MIPFFLLEGDFFMNDIKIIETPRDGIQALNNFIPTEKKIEYINLLLRVGFHTVEVGSFVSPKHIPQLADTEEVLNGLDLNNTRSKLMVLIANQSGGMKAAEFEAVDYLLYPFSASPTFLKKNINSNFKKSFQTIGDLQNICLKSNKQLIVYLTMGLGNPYNDKWSIDFIGELIQNLYDFGLRIIPVSDITGESNPQIIKELYNSMISSFPDVEFGLHLHASKTDYYEKIQAAYEAGCRRFDTVIGGMGGCPMTGKELLSNLDTLDLINFCEEKGLEHGLKKETLIKAKQSINTH